MENGQITKMLADDEVLRAIAAAKALQAQSDDQQAVALARSVEQMVLSRIRADQSLIGAAALPVEVRVGNMVFEKGLCTGVLLDHLERVVIYSQNIRSTTMGTPETPNHG